MKNTRRNFLIQSGTLATGIGIMGLTACNTASTKSNGNVEAASASPTTVAKDLFFKISLAQWSLHNAFFKKEMDNLDFASVAKNEFGIDGIEYVNQFFKDKAEDTAYLNQMIQRAKDNGVNSLLIMIDGEGGLGSVDDGERTKAVENHYKWVNAAKYLGCHSIRVNAYGKGTAEEVRQAAIDGLGRVADYARKEDINVIVENHGGYSSNGQWLTDVISEVNLKNCGTLPDFGNFCIERTKDGCAEEYDRYKGVKEMMEYAFAVSAKTHDFDAAGNEIHTDYEKMLTIVKDAGYKGYIGIEYEGKKLSEKEGIKATKDLMVRVGQKLS